MTPEQKSRQQTEQAFLVFAEIPDKDLIALLDMAGLVVPEKRVDRIKAALIVWFHGSIPNNQVFDDWLK